MSGRAVERARAAIETAMERLANAQAGSREEMAALLILAGYSLVESEEFAATLLPPATAASPEAVTERSLFVVGGSR